MAPKFFGHLHALVDKHWRGATFGFSTPCWKLEVWDTFKLVLKTSSLKHGPPLLTATVFPTLFAIFLGDSRSPNSVKIIEDRTSSYSTNSRWENSLWSTTSHGLRPPAFCWITCNLFFKNQANLHETAASFPPSIWTEIAAQVGIYNQGLYFPTWKIALTMEVSTILLRQALEARRLPSK